MNVPQQKPRDKEKIRQQYLANLQLENSNNTLNLNASKMYKATGASSQVASTMTGAEKLSGLEGLKQIARDHLVSFRFANPLSAQDAVDGLNPEDIKFLNEYAQFIGTDFKGRNVPGKVITAYIKKLRKKMQETEGVDYGIQQSSGAGILLSGNGDVYSQGDIQELAMRTSGFGDGVVNEIFSLMNKINRQARGINLAQAQKEGPDRYALALKANSAFRENAPTMDQLLQMADADDPVAIISALQGAGRLDDYVASVGAEASSGPVSANAPFNEGESGVEGIGGVGDPPSFIRQDQLAQIREALTEFMVQPRGNKEDILRDMGVDITAIRDEDGLDDAFLEAYKGAILRQTPTAPFVSDGDVPEAGSNGSPTNLAPGGGPSPSGSPVVSPASDLTLSPEEPEGPYQDELDIRGGTPDENANKLDRLIVDVYNRGTSLAPEVLEPNSEEVEEIRAGVNDFWQYAQQFIPADGLPEIRPIMEQLYFVGLREGRDFVLQWLAETYRVIMPIYQRAKAGQGPEKGSPETASTTSNVASLGTPSTIGSQGTTRMIPKPKPPQVLSAGNEPKGRGIRGRGVGRKVESYDKPKPYKQFGRHLIHRHKLEDGIMMIKYPSGAKHPEMPTQRISEDLTKVLKEMADGKMPQYHHFQGLGLKDKELLHNVVRHTQFKDLQVPPPNKEALDKELDRFEILKGEIEAGNDNKELIREFKVMLMKFMRQGRIPKAQVNEIMEHLLLMGH